MSRRNLEANRLINQFANYLKKIDDALQSELNLYSWSEFYSPLKYACEGGKRIRPLILMLTAESIRDDGSAIKLDGNALSAASAIELLHTESVIHDDIIDEENLRRGKPTFHIKYGYNSSILTADFVLGIILNIGSKLNNPRVLGELSNAAIKMSEGEMMEITLGKNSSISQDDYIKVLEYKTASLFAASAKIGAIYGNGEEEQIHAMAKFGNLLGIAYQIHDDLVDWNNENRLFNMLVKKSNDPARIVEQMKGLYLSYSRLAKDELQSINDSPPKKHLVSLTDIASVHI